jgi:hypothetical protein
MLFFRAGGDGEKGSDPLIPVTGSFATKNPESNDRIFFRIVIDPGGALDILCNKPVYECIREEEINSLILFSDGIGSLTDQALQQDYPEDPDRVRGRIISQSQGTADDKSICFIRIKENS